MRILIDILVLMNPSIGEMLIGAVQPWIMLLLISIGLRQCRRMKQCHGLFTWLVRAIYMFEFLESVLNMSIFAGALGNFFFSSSSYQSGTSTVVDMAEVELNHSTHQRFEALNIPCKAGASCSDEPNGDCRPTEESTNHDNLTESLKKAFMEYRCQHYQRRCRIRAPCCNQVFDCRHCHNEAMNNINVGQKLRHEIPRHQISRVICSLCGTEQQVQQVCAKCGVCMGEYFCKTCKLFDDDTSKKQYHCNGCGICRVGGRESFFHCYKCGCCYSILLKNSHPCVEGAMHHDCPVCCEYLFESRNDVTVLPCGHTIHKNCLKEMREHYQYACPLCSKSVCDMSKVWEKYDMEIAAIPMPEPYVNKMVWILCNDCDRTSNVRFHVVAQKCPNCKSYNTRLTRG